MCHHVSQSNHQLLNHLGCFRVTWPNIYFMNCLLLLSTYMPPIFLILNMSQTSHSRSTDQCHIVPHPWKLQTVKKNVTIVIHMFLILCVSHILCRVLQNVRPLFLPTLFECFLINFFPWLLHSNKWQFLLSLA